MTRSVFVPVCIVASFAGFALCLPTHKVDCNNALTNNFNKHGVNRLSRGSSQPIFELKFVPQKNQSLSRDGLQTYKVQIQIGNPLIAFTKVKIMIKGKGKCGAGTLSFDELDFYDDLRDEPACPTLLVTDKENAMRGLPPLFWTPPTCGHVIFRAVVIEGGLIYYADKSSESNGHLTKTISVKEKASRDQHLQALCQVRERYSSAEILSRPSFMTRHKLSAAWMDRRATELALELRKSDNRMCCNEKTTEKQLSCFENTRRRRVDMFCEDGYPDLQFTALRQKHMWGKEKRCCFILGHHRYSCFGSSNQFTSGQGVTLLDYSMDETDPANDLVEFATMEDVDVLKMLKTVTFGTIPENTEEEEVEEEGEEKVKEDNNEEKDNDGEEDDEEEEDEEEEEEEKEEEEKEDEGDEGKEERDEETKNQEDNNEEEVTTKKKPHSTKIDITNIETKDQVNQTESSEDEPEKDMVKSPPFSGGKADIAHTTSKIKEEARTNRRRVPQHRNTPVRDLTSAEKRKITAKEELRRVPVPDQALTSAAEKRQLMTTRAEIPSKSRQSLTSAEKHQIAAERANVYGPVPQVSTYHTRPSLASVQKLSREVQKVNNRLLSTKRLIRQSAEKRLNGVENLEDEGVASLDETKWSLQRRMKKLQLKLKCCEDGEAIGRRVVGSFIHAWDECRHSSQKYRTSFEKQHGNKACHEQFNKCCMERALSMPAMTSREFRDAANLYLHGPGMTDMDGDDTSIFERRAPLQDAEDETGEAITNSELTGRYAEEERFDRESERRYQTMRTKDVDVEDEMDGPSRFDDVDNEDNPVLLTRHHNKGGKKAKSKGDDVNEMTDFDDRGFTGNPDYEDYDDDTNNEQNPRNADVLTRSSHPLSRTGNKQAPRKTRYDEFFDRSKTSHRDPGHGMHDLRTKNYKRTSRGVRKPRTRNSRRRSKTRRPKRRNSRMSRERLYDLKRNGYAQGHIRALDSQEMAAALGKRYHHKTLDSKEMAEAHKRRNTDSKENAPQGDMWRPYSPWRMSFRTG